MRCLVKPKLLPTSFSSWMRGCSSIDEGHPPPPGCHTYISRGVCVCVFVGRMFEGSQPVLCSCLSPLPLPAPAPQKKPKPNLLTYLLPTYRIIDRYVPRLSTTILLRHWISSTPVLVSPTVIAGTRRKDLFPSSQTLSITRSLRYPPPGLESHAFAPRSGGLSRGTTPLPSQNGPARNRPSTLECTLVRII